MASASLRISTFYLGIVILGLFPAPTAFADEVSEISQDKEIEAVAYDLKTIRPSKSGRVYLFQKSDSDFPVDGKIFLLRQGDTPVMAFRVLKTYPATKRLAAKKLLPYEGFPKLEKGSEYRAFEKVGDKVKPVPPSPEDLRDLQELEAGSPEEIPAPPPAEGLEPVDDAPPAELTTSPEAAPPEPLPEPTPELPPAETSPQPEAKAPEPPPEEPADEDVEMRNTEEEDEYDEVGGYFPNHFTMGVGIFAKMKVPGPDMKFSGGFLYSKNFGESLAAEGGFFYYKSSGDETGSTIATTIMPIVANLRYQRRWNDLWTGYLYGGLVYPYVASNVGATRTQLAQIQTIWPAFGMGVFLQTGPNWYMRFNLGYEAVFLGVSLRY